MKNFAVIVSTCGIMIGTIATYLTQPPLIEVATLIVLGGIVLFQVANLK